MKRTATIKWMIVANPPAARARVLPRRRVPGTKLKLQKFESHRFTPKIQKLSDQSLCPKSISPASERKQIGRMLVVIHRVMPVSRSLIRTLPTNLC
ncbi:MAG: hypothetical protein AAB370_03400 [Verrucomicrobiota bacterium]